MFRHSRLKQLFRYDVTGFFYTVSGYCFLIFKFPVVPTRFQKVGVQKNVLLASLAGCTPTVKTWRCPWSRGLLAYWFIPSPAQRSKGMSSPIGERTSRCMRKSSSSVDTVSRSEWAAADDWAWSQSFARIFNADRCRRRARKLNYRSSWVSKHNHAVAFLFLESLQFDKLLPDPLVVFGTYIVPQAAYAASSTLCVADRTGVQPRPHTKTALAEFCLHRYSCMQP